jgi:hypothetical protein
MILASAVVKIGILLVLAVVFISVYVWLSDYLQRRGP